MKLIDISNIPDTQYMAFLRWFSIKNPETIWYPMFLDRLKMEGGKLAVARVLKKLLVDPEGFEFLAIYRNSLICPVENGMTHVSFVASYSLESRYEAEKTLEPNCVMTLTCTRVDKEGIRWVKMEHCLLSSLPLEPAPAFTAADVQWSRDEGMKREIEQATDRIREKWGKGEEATDATRGQEPATVQAESEPATRLPSGGGS